MSYENPAFTQDFLFFKDPDFFLLSYFVEFTGIM